MAPVDAAEQYRRFDAALAALAEFTAGPDGAGVARALAGDDLVLARMRLAAAVIREAGLPVAADGGRTGAEPDLLSRAAAWQRYGAGPVIPLHAACARDLTRGLLREWDRRRPRSRTLRTARLRLAGQVRVQCAAVRAELLETLAEVREPRAFREHARTRVGHAVARLDAVLQAELAAVDGRIPVPTPAPNPDLPPVPPVRLEHRLIWLFGGGFGLGAAMTVGHLAADLLPVAAAGAGTLGGAAGLALGGWVIRTRRTLSVRAALERWVAEVSAVFRASMEEHIAAELLAANGSGRFGD